jgi:hypothetical protein
MNKIYEINKLQKLLWFEWKMNPSSNAYNNIYIYKVGFNVNLSNLRRGLLKLHQLFPLLSSQFNEVSSRIQLRLTRTTEVNLAFLHSKDNLTSLLLLPFNLNSDPLYRYAIYVDDDETYLGFCWHHIITDAHSINIILKIISNFLVDEKFCQSKINYDQIEHSEVLDRQNNNFQQTQATAQSYWKMMLHNVSPCLLYSKENLSLENRSNKGKRLVFSLPSDLTYVVMHKAGQLKTTLFSFIASCIAKFLFNNLDENKLILGFAENCRERSYLNQVGNFAAPFMLILERSNDSEYLVNCINDQIKTCRSINQFMLSDIYRLYRHETQSTLKKLFNVSINYGTDFCTPLFDAAPEIYEGFDCTNDLIIRYEYIVPKNSFSNKHNTIVFEIDYNTAKFSNDDVQHYVDEIMTQISCA